MASEPPASVEGEIPFAIPDAGQECVTWYKIVGSLTASSSSSSSCSKLPVIALHGGPGAGHDSLAGLADLHTRHGHAAVVFYDQVGCGRSTHLAHRAGDDSFWTPALFVRELDNLVDRLGLRARGFHLVGNSWGGMLGAAWAARPPAQTRGLRRLVLSGAPASMPLYNRGCRRRIAQLPDAARSVLEDPAADHAGPAFQEAAMVFAKTFVCRLETWPDALRRSWQNVQDDPTVYNTMQGTSEFATVGNLRDWEGWRDAHAIAAETLLINGRWDEVMDFVMAPWFRHIAKCKWVTIEEASHAALWETRDRYMDLCADFFAMSDDGSES